MTADVCHSSPRDVSEDSNFPTCRRWESEISRALDFPDAKFVASSARRSGAPTLRICELRCRKQLQDAYLHLHAGSSLQLAIRSARWRVPRAFVQTCVPRFVAAVCLVSLAAFLGEAVCLALRVCMRILLFCPPFSRLHYYMSWLVALDNLTADTLQTNCTWSCVLLQESIFVIRGLLLQLSKLESAQKPCTILAREHS